MSDPIRKELGIAVRYDSFLNRILIELDEHKISLPPEDASTLSDLLREAVTQLKRANERKQ
jgi:hypothetical protein